MHKPLIMAVDDETMIADAVAAILKETGRYEAITAYSAKEALEHLDKNKILWGMGGNHIRLIILDIKMPEMDGLQFLEKIRKEYSEYIGVTLLTAWEDEEKWERATSGFVISYLKKPFRKDDLISTVDTYFAGKEGEMVMHTFEEHLEKKKEFGQEPHEKS